VEPIDDAGRSRALSIGRRYHARECQRAALVYILLSRSHYARCNKQNSHHIPSHNIDYLRIKINHGFSAIDRDKQDVATYPEGDRLTN
jgi:hypothetical protein